MKKILMLCAILMGLFMFTGCSTTEGTTSIKTETIQINKDNFREYMEISVSMGWKGNYVTTVYDTGERFQCTDYTFSMQIISEGDSSYVSDVNITVKYKGTKDTGKNDYLIETGSFDEWGSFYASFKYCYSEEECANNQIILEHTLETLLSEDFGFLIEISGSYVLNTKVYK